MPLLQDLWAHDFSDLAKMKAGVAPKEVFKSGTETIQEGGKLDVTVATCGPGHEGMRQSGRGAPYYAHVFYH